MKCKMEKCIIVNRDRKLSYYIKKILIKSAQVIIHNATNRRISEYNLKVIKISTKNHFNKKWNFADKNSLFKYCLT